MTASSAPSPFTEDDLLPVSALADLVFCERRAALHFIEGIWQDNVATIEGTYLHEKTHDPGTESRAGVRIVRGLALRSLRLGLSGKADIVEFHKRSAGFQPAKKNSGQDGRAPTDRSAGFQPAQNNGGQDGRAPTDGQDGFAPAEWQPFPVEYKRGKLRKEDGYEVQLCAQALCLEEMLGTDIPAGAIFYGKTRRRLDVALDEALRRETEAAAARLHALIASGVTPRAFREPKCEQCSLLQLCMPDGNRPGRSASQYLANALKGGS